MVKFKPEGSIMNMKEKQNFEFPIVSITKNEFDAVQKWIEKYRDRIFGKNLFIFGAGIRGNMFLKLLEESGVAVSGFCDSSIEKQGAHVKNYTIYKPEDIYAEPEKNLVLVSPENSTDIEKMLKEHGYEKEKNYFIIGNTMYSDFKKEFFKTEGTKYILFGDCFFVELDVDDLRGKTIGNLVKQKLGVSKTKVLSIPGMCIPSFYHLMRMQIEMGIKPAVVAFIVNIPFCNGIQTKLPQSQHPALFRDIQTKLPFNNNVFARYVDLTEVRAGNINAKGFSTKRIIKEKDDGHVEKLLAKSRYMYKFNEENENIEYLKKMIILLQENNIKPVPFIPSLNYYTGEEYFGREFMQRYSDICNQIRTCLNKYGVDILDMSVLLEKDDFIGTKMTKFPGERGKNKEVQQLCKRLTE